MSRYRTGTARKCNLPCDVALKQELMKIHKLRDLFEDIIILGSDELRQCLGLCQILRCVSADEYLYNLIEGKDSLWSVLPAYLRCEIISQNSHFPEQCRCFTV